MDLILASTSPYRRDLLARLGLRFRCVAPPIDEEALKDDLAPAFDLAERLAAAKASSVFRGEPDTVVIGSDQLISCDSRVFGKPGTSELAIAQLLALAGREHALITSVAVADRDGVEVDTVVARLTIRSLTREEAERYVTADQPFDCAGSYRIEGLGIALFERIDVEDQTAIIGLPLMTVCRMLRSRGFQLP
jgi:septum formation protein